MSGNAFTAALLARRIQRDASDAVKASGVPLPITVFIAPIDDGYRAEIAITISHAVAAEFVRDDDPA